MLVDKFGGLPWGLTRGAWPMCGGCGRPQSHVAQFAHHDHRLDLGGPGRVLVLFQCEWVGECLGMTARPEWGGRNAALVIPSMGDGITEPPDPRPDVLPEMRVVEWVAHDDGIDGSRYEEFFRNDRFVQLYEEGVLDALPFGTKAGGPPRWVQSFEDGPPPPWRFVLQLSEAQQGDGPEPTSQETGWGLQRVLKEYSAGPPPQRMESLVEYPEGMGQGDVPVRIEVSSIGWFVGGPNFGVGTAYVFVNTAVEPPAALMLWQR
jgi:hypothetical protein